jgi:glycosyltransferase involved in cell wall biosynthesis
MARFSIVLTTTDRPSLLPASVRAVLETDFADLELIVSDNFSRLPAAEILADVRDKRLRVIRTDRRLVAPDHWEFVWDHVCGDYVMFLGDDNALHPDMLRLADRMVRAHDLEILSWRNCIYYHPGWDIVFGPLPNRGNILGLDVGSTGQLYRCNPRVVLEKFCRDLRFSGCFPCMLNFLFRKSLGDKVRERAGRIFWAPNPDVSMSYLMLGMARDDGYGFLDGFGAIGGRSKDSNLGSLLSRGKASRRVHDYVDEFANDELFPHHRPKFITMSNSLAAIVSQAKTVMPERFAGFDFDPTMLARRSIEDMYVDRTVPWLEDPAFVADVDKFIAALPSAAAAEMFAYRDECRARMQETESGARSSPAYVRNADEARVSILGLCLTGNPQAMAFAWRLFREVGRNPLGRYWVSGGTTYVDMDLYGCRDIADAASNLPRLLARFDQPGEAFADYHRQIGMLGEPMASEVVGTTGAAIAKPMAAVQ